MKALLVMVLLLVAVSLASLAIGDQAIAPAGVVAAILTPADAPPADVLIITSVRLPRLLLGLLVGFALGLSGVLAQAVLRNPLAEPGLLGINAGAALSATVVLMLVRAPSPYLLPVSAFAGAIGVAALTWLFWRFAARSSPVRLVLIGIGISAFCGVLATAISISGTAADAQRTMNWLVGSVYDSGWRKVTATAQWLVLPVIASLLLARELDFLQLGDEIARGIGQHVARIQAIALALCALVAAVAVAAAGPIAFVGLCAPHIARRLIGRGHALLLPSAGLCGALIVVAADLLGRGAVNGVQLPVGIVTPILGAPALALLLYRARRSA